MPVQHDTVSVGAVQAHILSLKDRRRRPHRVKRWMFLRSLSQCLYGQATTGAVNKLLCRVSMQASTLCIGGASVPDLVTEEELADLLALFRSMLDAESAGRTRNVTLCPLSGACSVLPPLMPAHAPPLPHVQRRLQRRDERTHATRARLRS